MIPDEILIKSPSAELSFNQRDSDALPDYYYLDAILKLYLDKNILCNAEILKLQAISNKIDNKEQKRIHNMIRKSEFKRKQASPILSVSIKTFGIGRIMPISYHFNVK